MTRREALTVLAAGAISRAKAASPIIRTVLKDLPPEALSGATLFHEHLSLAPDFMPKWIGLARGQNTQTKTGPAASPPMVLFSCRMPISWPTSCGWPPRKAWRAS